MPVNTKAKLGRKPDPGLAARRRDQILDTATARFAKRGYAETDLDDVAGAIGIGKGTIYRYFPTKKALFLGAVDRVMKRLNEEVDGEAGAATDPLERIAMAIRHHLRYFDRHPEAVELVIQERAQFRDRPTPTYFESMDANLAPWTALLNGLIAAGRLRRVPVSRIVHVLGDLMYGTIFTARLARRRTNLETQARDILDIAFNGMLAQRERAK